MAGRWSALLYKEQAQDQQECEPATGRRLSATAMPTQSGLKTRKQSLGGSDVVGVFGLGRNTSTSNIVKKLGQQ
ncbi:hypothetical protein ASPCADRAFT_205168 [Aspergillus carbonarius ITEM 5010]|uniref:Uncharacterized protein n=1 Tax=Aspergillus carbonarius (strain ITEM 5010) TaxID=602072 RepID=A0A1R3RTT9_ASPC5|nr:hypothetical protein ASPCADRAFT_205168 [Aspergillus carbonarius ITEM 5010]